MDSYARHDLGGREGVVGASAPCIAGDPGPPPVLSAPMGQPRVTCTSDPGGGEVSPTLGECVDPGRGGGLKGSSLPSLPPGCPPGSVPGARPGDAAGELLELLHHHPVRPPAAFIRPAEHLRRRREGCAHGPPWLPPARKPPRRRWRRLGCGRRIQEFSKTVPPSGAQDPTPGLRARVGGDGAIRW